MCEDVLQWVKDSDAIELHVGRAQPPQQRGIRFEMWIDGGRGNLLQLSYLMASHVHCMLLKFSFSSA
jgi:hypothetical protein